MLWFLLVSSGESRERFVGDDVTSIHRIVSDSTVEVEYFG